MTTFLGDWSNHDWGRGGMDFPAMRRDGILGGTHKTSDGLNFYRDPYWPGATGRMKAAFGDGIYGSYHVMWGNRSIEAQVDWWFSILDATAPGWRTDPQFVLMTDNEPFGYNAAPTIGQVNQAGDTIKARVSKTQLAYCPPWHYGAALDGLRYPLVSSSYGNNPVAHYLPAYPGDGSGRWTTAAPVALLQYGSQTRMGSQSTCDGNAFRGTIDQLRALITGGETTMTTPVREDYAYPRVDAIANLLDVYPPGPEQGHGVPLVALLKEMRDNGRWAYPRLEALTHMLSEVRYGPEAGKPVELVQALTRIEAAVTATATAVGPTQTQVDAAIEKALLNPAVQKGIGDAIAAHLHVD